MLALLSPRARHRTWRTLWIELARAQRDLGLPIGAEQIEDMEAHADEFDWERLATLERELRHDVMAHVRHFGEVAPEARGIIHLGATSAFVTDNADLIVFRDALRLVEQRLVEAIAALVEQARRYRDLPCLGYTHFQPAQPVTVGKRICLWIHDLTIDLDEVRRVLAWLPCRGVKGTTGTQASFLALFDGDHEKVKRLESMVVRAIGFTRAVPVSGQTYTRKIDSILAGVLAGVAQSAAKLANDVRLLCHEGEVEEPTESSQIGSSAMPYKKNPMRSERINSLARYVLAATATAGHTAAAQWLERTLDDSAVRRIALPEAFLAVDAILILVASVARGLVVHPGVIRRRLAEVLPFLVSEEILMAAVRAGGDRQELHERLRRLAWEEAAEMKRTGGKSRLCERIAADEAFAAVRERLEELSDPFRLTGRAAAQVEEFLRDEVAPRLAGSARRGAGEEPRV